MMQEILLGLNLLLTSGVLAMVARIAYGYGKLEQRVDGHDRELERHDQEMRDLWANHNRLQRGKESGA